MAREQLTVKQHLFVLAFICAPVALWVAYKMTFTESISAPSVKIGQPIIVRGHYPGWYGADYMVFATVRSPDIVGEIGEAPTAGAGVATRGWLGYYRFEATLDPINEPGNYTVFLMPNQKESSGTATAELIVLPR